MLTHIYLCHVLLIKSVAFMCLLPNFDALATCQFTSGAVALQGLVYAHSTLSHVQKVLHKGACLWAGVVTGIVLPVWDYRHHTFDRAGLSIRSTGMGIHGHYALSGVPHGR